MKTSLLISALCLSMGALAQNINQSSLPLFDEEATRQKMQEDGLSEPMINKLIEQRKELLKSGRNIQWIPVKKTPSTNSSCNMGGENGWDTWQWMTGTNSAGQPVWGGPPAANPPSPNFTITNGVSIDPNTPGPSPAPALPVVCPGFGNNSIKIGDNCTAGCVCEQLIYSLNVTPGDTTFPFAYAAVIEDAGHAPIDQPFVSFCVYDQSGNPIPGACFIDTGSASMSGYYTVSGTGCAYAGVDHYKPWTYDTLNLAAYVGQAVTIVITNADCSQCGHFAYSYWDFSCMTANFLNINVSANNMSCGSQCNGTASVTTAGGTPPYTYSWSTTPVQTTSTATGLCAGTYTIMVSDSTGFTASNTVSIINLSPPSTPSVCMVTVDSLSQYNVVIWDKTPYVNLADSFFIYREISTNNYQLIGGVPYGSLSLFVDTVRTLYFPNTGDPNAGTYRYKITVGDTCGAYSALSPYHNTIFITNNSGNFFWAQLYTIEGSSNPVSAYVLMRDDSSNGNWHAVNSVSGTQQNITDPAYATWQAIASWRVETQWSITCTPTVKNPAVLATNYGSSLSNVFTNNTSAVNDPTIENSISISPNPSFGHLSIDFGMKNFGKADVSISDLTGRILFKTSMAACGKQRLDVSELTKGIYFLKLSTETGMAAKKIVIAR